MRVWALVTAFLIESFGQSPAEVDNNQIANGNQIVLDYGLDANMTMDAMMLGQTYDNARLTYYDITVGTTACGKRYKNSDYVVALNGAQFGSGYPGPHCFKNIHLSVGGKSVTAQIVDECPGCPHGGLDLTEGLFQHFAPLDKGVLKGSWYFL